MELVISELKANDLHDTGAAYDKQDPAVFIRVGSVTQPTARYIYILLEKIDLTSSYVDKWMPERMLNFQKCLHSLFLKMNTKKIR